MDIIVQTFHIFFYPAISWIIQLDTVICTDFYILITLWYIFHVFAHKKGAIFKNFGAFGAKTYQEKTYQDLAKIQENNNNGTRNKKSIASRLRQMTIPHPSSHSFGLFSAAIYTLLCFWMFVCHGRQSFHLSWPKNAKIQHAANGIWKMTRAASHLRSYRREFLNTTHFFLVWLSNNLSHTAFETGQIRLQWTQKLNSYWENKLARNWLNRTGHLNLTSCSELSHCTEFTFVFIPHCASIFSSIAVWMRRLMKSKVNTGTKFLRVWQRRDDTAERLGNCLEVPALVIFWRKVTNLRFGKHFYRFEAEVPSWFLVALGLW